MDNSAEDRTPPPKARTPWKVILYILGTFILFFLGLEMMLAAFQHVRADVIREVLKAVANPFAGLFIGLLATAVMQSSSTTTAVAVALVASGSMTLRGAVPVIMGANIGTTITGLIIAIGFINEKKDFKRAFGAATFHCFFNLLTTLILFPLEQNTGFLSGMSVRMASIFSGGNNTRDGIVGNWSVFGSMPESVGSFTVALLMLFAFICIFGSVLLFRRYIAILLRADSPHVFSRFFFPNSLKSFGWGLLTTAAIRSSTVTTSVVVAVVARKMVSLRKAAPFIMGANVGTTVTAFIAAVGFGYSHGAIAIAIAHFLFNLAGVLVFMIRPLFEIPLRLAKETGSIAYRYKVVGFLFILLTFFIIPVTLIFLSQ